MLYNIEHRYFIGYLVIIINNITIKILTNTLSVQRSIYSADIILVFE